MMKAYMPIDMAHRVTEMTHTGAHPTGHLMQYLPIYTAGLATIAVGLAATEFFMDLHKDQHKDQHDMTMVPQLAEDQSGFWPH